MPKITTGIIIFLFGPLDIVGGVMGEVATGSVTGAGCCAAGAGWLSIKVVHIYY